MNNMNNNINIVFNVNDLNNPVINYPKNKKNYNELKKRFIPICSEVLKNLSAQKDIKNNIKEIKFVIQPALKNVNIIVKMADKLISQKEQIVSIKPKGLPRQTQKKIQDALANIKQTKTHKSKSNKISLVSVENKQKQSLFSRIYQNFQRFIKLNAITSLAKVKFNDLIKSKEYNVDESMVDVVKTNKNNTSLFNGNQQANLMVISRIRNKFRDFVPKNEDKLTDGDDSTQQIQSDNDKDKKSLMHALNALQKDPSFYQKLKQFFLSTENNEILSFFPSVVQRLCKIELHI